MISTAIALAGVSFIAYFVYTTWSGYKAATGTVWQRLLASSRDSATMLWSKFCLALSAVVANLDTIADALGQPEAKQYIQDLFSNPKVVAGILGGVMLLNMLARLRSLGKAA
jgi:hypothetical protein